MVKTLIKQIKEYKKDSLLTMLFAALEVILEVLLIKGLRQEICLMLQNMEHSCLLLQLEHYHLVF